MIHFVNLGREKAFDKMYHDSSMGNFCTINFSDSMRHQPKTWYATTKGAIKHYVLMDINILNRETCWASSLSHQWFWYSKRWSCTLSCESWHALMWHGLDLPHGLTSHTLTSLHVLTHESLSSAMGGRYLKGSLVPIVVPQFRWSDVFSLLFIPFCC